MHAGLLQRGAAILGHLADQPAQIDALRLQQHFAQFQPRSIEQLIDQPAEVSRLALGRVEGSAARLRSRRFLTGDVQAAEDRRQRVAQLVGHQGLEIAAALRFLGQLGGPLAQRLLQPLGRRHVFMSHHDAPPARPPPAAPPRR